MRKEASPEKVVQEIRRKTRRRFSAEEKIRIVLEGLRGEESIAALCRREGLKKDVAGSIGQCNSGRSVSAGVAYPSVLRGRELRRCAMVLRSACV